MSASDVAYQNLSESAKSKGEYQFLRKAMVGAPNGIHQGIYIVTPSGKYMKQCNVGWPELNPLKCLALMREAVREFAAMPKSSRLAELGLKDEDRALPKSLHISPAAEWLKIRSITRSYPFADMELFDLRHPRYFKIDRLWMTPEVARTLLPMKLAMGESSAIKGRALEHMIYDGHLMLGCPPWPRESVKEASMQVRVNKVKGKLYGLVYTGEFHLDADSQWNQSSYRGQLLGKAIWDDSKKQFLQLKWVTLGERNQRVLRSNETRGKVHITTVGSVLDLDPRHPNDRNILPHSWADRYSPEMKR